MEKEFNLSEKIQQAKLNLGFAEIVPTWEIKEFIKNCEDRAVDMGTDVVVRLSDIKELAGESFA